MDHNPPTMGDMAYNEVRSERFARQTLEKRVATLEAELERVVDWSETVADALNDVIKRIDALTAKP